MWCARVWIILVMSAAAAASGPASSRTQPHIVVIVADDLGWNDVGFNGMNHIRTPNLDALAASGRVLTRHYVLPICTPSRAALVTGKYPIHTGMQNGVIYGMEARGLPLSETILPERMRSLGYNTHLVGKWHLGSHRSEYLPTNRGFDSHVGFWLGKIDMYDHTNMERGSWGFDFRRGFDTAHDLFGKYATDVYTDEAVKIIKQYNSSRPLFLMLCHSAVHSGNPNDPIRAPQILVDQYRRINDTNRQKFAGVLSALDSSVGDVVSALSDASLLSDTVIVFMSDNGGVPDGFNDNAGSNYPLRGTKNTLWEGGVRGAALLWAGPGVTPPGATPPGVTMPGGPSHCLIHVTDWLPTLYQLAGGDVKSLGDIDGMSQWDALTRHSSSDGSCEGPRSTVLLNIDDSHPSAGYIRWPWKLVKGTSYSGKWDGWYGPSGREVSYDIEAVYQSQVAHAANTLGIMPNRERYLHIRSECTVRCEDTSVSDGDGNDGIETSCSPLVSPCLYNIQLDPCETNNLADREPELMSTLLSSLSAYNKTALRPNNRVLCDAADPQYWGRVYTTFADFLPPTAPPTCL